LPIEKPLLRLQSQITNRKSSISTYGVGQYFLHTPSFPRTQRTRFDYAHTISNLAGFGFIMRQKLRSLPLDFLVEGVLHQPIDGNRYRLLHSGAGYFANLALADSPFLFCTHRFL
jgi:hypothetical protein